MAFPDVPIADNFTRANEDPLVTSSSGVAWAVTANQIGLGVTAMRVVSNVCAGDSNSSFMYLNSTYGPNVQVAMTVTTVGGTGAILDINVRVPASLATDILTLSGYVVRLTINAGTDTIIIGRVDNTVITNLNSFAQEVSTGDSIGMSVVGDLITGYYKAAAGSWTVLGTGNDSTYTAGGFIAVTMATNVARIDDLYGGTFNNFVPRGMLLGVGG